jgi:RNA polymerase sigma factor (sigma-70 family)
MATMGSVPYEEAGDHIMTAEDPAPTHLLVTDLVVRAKNGDELAWGALVELYAPLIWSVCRRYQLTRADAEDVAQVVWQHLVGELDRIRNPPAIPAWLVTTTRRECLRVQRAAQRSCPAGYVLDAEDVPDDKGVTPEQELLVTERHAVLREALARLPPGCRQLLTLLIADPPVPYTEISARLGIPAGSIGPSRARCLEKLRRDPAIAALIDADEGREVTRP